MLVIEGKVHPEATPEPFAPRPLVCGDQMGAAQVVFV
jgi:hypothetical protein